MTAISPSNGVRARARRMLRRLGATAAAAALMIGAVTPSASADETPPPSEQKGEVTLHLSAGVDGAIPGAGPLVATASVSNGTESALSEGRMTFELNRTPLTTSDALDGWLDRGVTGGTFEEVSSQTSSVVERDKTSLIGAAVSAPDFAPLAPGIYPVRARLSSATTGPKDDQTSWNLTASAVVVVRSGAAPSVSAIVPITATPKAGGLLTAEELTALTAPEGALTAVLTGVSGTTAVLAIDPSVPAAIRALGSSAPVTATAWLDALESLPNDRFALQFGDADAATQAHAKLPSLLAPTSLTALLNPADFAQATPTPTPTANDAAPALPDNAALTALRGASSGILWPRADVTADDLTAFAAYLGDDVVTILPDTAVGGERGGVASTGSRRVLVTSSSASDRLSAAVEETDATARDREIGAAAAHLLLNAATAGSAPLLVGLDRSETRDGGSLHAALASLGATGPRLSTLTAAAPVRVDVTAKADSARAPMLHDLLVGEQELTQFGTILKDPLVLLAPERIQILRLIGVGLAPDDVTTAVAAHHKATRKTLSSVGVQEPSPVQLLTAAAPLPVWIRNELPWPVTVELSSQPSDPRLDVQPITEVQAGRASNTRVTIPVEARLASGELEVEFRLTSPTGVPIGDPAIAPVTVRADWENIGLGILGGIIVLLLAFGIVRTVRRRRRGAQDQEEGASDDETPDDERSAAKEIDE